MIYFHGTSKSSAKEIKQRGFDINFERRSDPGDLGWGIYFSTDYYRAKSYGSEVLAVEISSKAKLAKIVNPYFIKNLEHTLPTTPEEILFYNVAFDNNGNMITVHQSGINRENTSKTIRQTFIDAGYDGIIAGPFNPRRKDLELVVFNPSIISSIYEADELIFDK